VIVKRNHKIFITGTNTDVGKTFIGLNLVRLAIKKGLKIIPFKPIETGCRIIKSKLIPDDSYRYYKLLDERVSLDLINPYRFKPPISPNMAIKLARKRINIRNYLNKIEILPKHDYLLVEGAGGICSPIAIDGLNIDLIKKINSPILLVAKDEIGVINNVLLCINIIKKYKLTLLAIILNKIENKQPIGMNNYQELSSMIKKPIIQINNKKPSNEKSFEKILKVINFKN
tara:strand:- start:1213 stop:1899 length:687 start_codon:yes stop_codon:yes gene_type:complete